MELYCAMEKCFVRVFGGVVNDALGVSFCVCTYGLKGIYFFQGRGLFLA